MSRTVRPCTRVRQPRVRATPARGLRRGRCQQIDRIDPHALGQPLERAQREIAFTSFDAAHVRAVHAEGIREFFLADATRFAIGPDVDAGDALKVTFHASTIIARYLKVYIPMSSIDSEGTSAFAPRGPGFPRSFPPLLARSRVVPRVVSDVAART